MLLKTDKFIIIKIQTMNKQDLLINIQTEVNQAQAHQVKIKKTETKPKLLDLLRDVVIEEYLSKKLNLSQTFDIQ